MPSITQRTKRDGSSSFQVAVRLAGAKPCYETFDSKEQAERFASGLEEELRAKRRTEFGFRSESVMDRLMRENLAKVVVDFVDHKAEERRLASTLSKTAKPFRGGAYDSVAPTVVKNLKGVCVGDINRSWMKSYVTLMRNQTTSRNTVFAYESIAKHLTLIRSAIKWRAYELDLNEPPSLPTVESILPKNYENKRERRFENDEPTLLHQRLRKIRSPSRPHWIALVCLALETGARLQELVLAEWKEFDIQRGIWTLPAAHTKCNKTREVPLSGKALAVLLRLDACRDADDPRVLHRLGTANSASQGFHDLSKSAGLLDFRFHDLRHEAVSRMVLNKPQYTVYEIMQIVGHSSLAMFQRYAKLRGEELAWKMR